MHVPGSRLGAGYFTDSVPMNFAAVLIRLKKGKMSW